MVAPTLWLSATFLVIQNSWLLIPTAPGGTDQGRKQRKMSANSEIETLAVVILAAGKGTRMNSSLPKVLHLLGKKPLLAYPVEVAHKLGADRIVVIVGYKSELVKEAFSGMSGLDFALQEPQLGTGHAVICASDKLKDHKGDVLILYGDVPGIGFNTLKNLIQKHRSQAYDLTVLGMEPEDPAQYGRFVTNESGDLLRIVEFRDANDEEREISKVNAGIYLARTQAMLKYLPMLNTNNDQKEYYLTDLVEIMHGKGLKVGYSICSDPTEVAGVNSMAELKALEKKMFHQDKEVLECAG